jgi:hypothetical protein
MWHEDAIQLTINFNPPYLANLIPNNFIQWTSTGFVIPDNTLDYFFYWDSIGVGTVNIALPSIGISTTVVVDRPNVGETMESVARGALYLYIPAMAQYRNEAISWADPFSDPKKNALRHAYWHSLMSSDGAIGAALAIYLSTSHEYSTKYGDPGLLGVVAATSPYSEAPDCSVDLYNNLIGSGVSRINLADPDNPVPDRAAIQNVLLQLYNDGGLWIADQNKFIRKSNNEKLYGNNGCCAP